MKSLEQYMNESLVVEASKEQFSTANALSIESAVEFMKYMKYIWIRPTKDVTVPETLIEAIERFPEMLEFLNKNGGKIPAGSIVNMRSTYSGVNIYIIEPDGKAGYEAYSHTILVDDLKDMLNQTEWTEENVNKVKPWKVLGGSPAYYK